MDNIIVIFSYLLPIINELMNKEFSKENITGVISDYEKTQVTLTIPLAMFLLLHGQKIDEKNLSDYLTCYNFNWAFYFNLLELQETPIICINDEVSPDIDIMNYLKEFKTFEKICLI